MTGLEWGLGLYSAATIAVGQVLLKLASTRLSKVESLISLDALSWPLVAGLGVYGTGMVTYLLLLRSVDLSLAYVFVLCGAVFVPVLSVMIFGETITPRYVAGFALILAGLWLVAK
ncbi:MAG: EamA family transporter [Litorimonas sp.]